MRFITEFKLPEYQLKVESRKNVIIESYAARHKADIGNTIGDAFGWENPVNDNHLHYKLDIEAFPMDKWVEFKHKLASLFRNDDYAGNGFEDIAVLIKELESFGKPAGEANIPTNPPIVQTGVEYFFDTQSKTVHRKGTDGEIEDLTNPHIKE